MGPQVFALLFFILALLIVMVWKNLMLRSKSSAGASGEGGFEEWPIIAESANDYDIDLLKSRLETADIPVIAETDTRNALQGAVNLMQNRLRVKPEFEQSARELLEAEGKAKFLT